MSFDKSYNLFTNLSVNKTEILIDKKNVYLSGYDINNVKIDLLIDKTYTNFQNFNNEIETDIFKTSSLEEAEIKIKRVNNFIKDYFNDKSDLKLLVPQSDYDSNQF